MLELTIVTLFQRWLNQTRRELSLVPDEVDSPSDSARPVSASVIGGC